MERYLRFPLGRAKALTLSYDDGMVFDKRLIELMRESGIKGTFNINSGLFGVKRRLKEEQIVETYSGNDIEVAVHGYYHQWPDAITGVQAVTEFALDKEKLEKLFNRVVRGMAYAYGKYTNEVIEILKLIGIKYSRTTESSLSFDMPSDWLRLKPTCHHKNEKLIELAKNFNDAKPNEQRNRKPMLFYVWGHSYEFNDNNNWEIIEEFFQLVGKREDVWYATNIEIYDYAKAYENLDFSADGKLVYNRSSIDVWFFQDGKTVMAKAGETTKID